MFMCVILILILNQLLIFHDWHLVCLYVQLAPMKSSVIWEYRQNIACCTMLFFPFYFMRQRCSLGYLPSAQPSPPLLPCAVRVNSQRHLCSFLCTTVAPHYVLLGPSFGPGHLSRPTNNPQSLKVKRGIVHGWLAVTVNGTFWNGVLRNRVLNPYLFDFFLKLLLVLWRNECFKHVLMRFVSAQPEL